MERAPDVSKVSDLENQSRAGCSRMPPNTQRLLTWHPGAVSSGGQENMILILLSFCDGSAVDVWVDHRFGDLG